MDEIHELLRHSTHLRVNTWNRIFPSTQGCCVKLPCLFIKTNDLGFVFGVLFLISENIMEMDPLKRELVSRSRLICVKILQELGLII